MGTWGLENKVCVWGGGGGGGKHIFITTFIKRIQFCFLTGNEKENSSQIYQTRAQTVFI